MDGEEGKSGIRSRGRIRKLIALSRERMEKRKREGTEPSAAVAFRNYTEWLRKKRGAEKSKGSAE